MTSLVALLIYQQVRERADNKRQADEGLLRLATFAAYAERERFDAAERLLVLATPAQAFREVAATPSSTDAFDRCTRTLFVLDQILPENTETTGFALWDTSGKSLCSSKGAKLGEYSVSDRLWYQTASQRQALATGAYELAPPDNQPSIAFGVPIVNTTTSEVVAYLSVGLRLNRTDTLLAGGNLPNTGRVSVVDQNGVIIDSSDGRGGQPTQRFPAYFGSLATFLDSNVVGVDGRRAAGVRITDAGDAAVTVVISADEDALVTPLWESVSRDLGAVAVVCLLTLGAVWFLGQRWVVRPVESLVRASDAVEAGDLGARARISARVTEFERLAASFNAMASTRERASHAKDEFLGLVSHELKTPITTVLGNAEILRRREASLDAEMRHAALDDIYEGAQRLDSIIDNLLALARLDRGAALEREPLALLRMTETLVEAQSRRYPGRRINVRGESTVWASGGVTHFEQVLHNLLANAMKYSPADSVVHVVIERSGTMAILRVQDSGQGVAVDEQSAVFEPFYRSPRTAGYAEGMGIGLSVCKRLVMAMGGTIWCGARWEGGSEFGFSLPLLEDVTPMEGAGTEPEPTVPDVHQESGEAPARPVVALSDG